MAAVCTQMGRRSAFIFFGRKYLCFGAGDDLSERAKVATSWGMNFSNCLIIETGLQLASFLINRELVNIS